MFNNCKLKIENVYWGHGNVLHVSYRCSNCKCVMNVAQQQNLSYCFHCGARIWNQKEIQSQTDEYQFIKGEPFENLTK